jgi:hypothetical protein
MRTEVGDMRAFRSRVRNATTAGAVVLAAVLLASCVGYTTGATNIFEQANGSFSAQLNFVASCSAREHCSWYVRYRRVGTSTWTHAPATPHGPVAGPLTKVSLAQVVTGLTARTQYEYQVCGNAQLGQPFACMGPNGSPNTTTKFTTPTLSSAATWKIQTTPNPDSPGYLATVTCTLASACTAVGSDTANGIPVTLAERWNGARWTVQRTPNPTGTTYGYLNGVSCISATRCVAVGDYSISDSGAQPLSEVWDGTIWRIHATPSPSNDIDVLNSVSCTSATACIAVGYGFNYTESERWNGSAWSILTTPPTGGSLWAVSCTSATACTAVGYHTHPAGPDVTLTERWNGTTWTIQNSANPSGTTFDFNLNYSPQNRLLGVSCVSPTACTAVGEYVNNDGVQVTLAEHWNGTTWTTQTTPNPNGATNSVLLGVSCTSATACTAVGEYVNPNGVWVTLAEHWNGTTWTIQTSPNPRGGTNNLLQGVSCTSTTACIAVGAYNNPDGNQPTLAERYSQ